MYRVDHRNQVFPTQNSKRSRSNTPLSSRIPLRQLNGTHWPGTTYKQIDQQDSSNPQRLGQYAHQIHQNLLQQERSFTINPNYLSQQPDINHRMRAILVDWIIGASLKFKLLPETLYISINLIDRYLQKKEVQRKHLQLVGISSMLIASKYQEIYPPHVKDFIYITDNAYTKDQLLKMEGDMLRTVAFAVSVPSTLRFLERYSRLARLAERNFAMARYLSELALVEYHMLKYPPSVIAGAAVYLSVKIFDQKQSWPAALEEYLSQVSNEIRVCGKDLLMLFQAAPRHSLSAVREKYARKEFFEVSSVRIGC